MSCQGLQLSEASIEIETRQVLEYLENSVEFLYIKLKNCSDSKTAISGEEIIKSIDEYLFQKICNELEYCRNKSRFSYMNTENLSRLLLKTLEDISKLDSISRPLLVAILIKIGLDKFCKC